MRVISPRVGETVASRPAPQPSIVYVNSVVQVPIAPRIPNLMIRVRSTTPIPDHEPEPVPQQPASPVLVSPSWHSASDIGVDQRPLPPQKEGHHLSRLIRGMWKSDMSDHHQRLHPSLLIRPCPKYRFTLLHGVLSSA